MSTARYALGWAELLAIVGPVAWAAARLRHRAWPGFTGAAACLADIVVVLAWVLLACELLGTVGLFRAVPVVLACALSGVVAGALAGAPPARDPGESGRVPRGALAAAAAVGLVAVGQLAPTLTALDGGIANFDSLEYHLTKAARWVQEGSLAGVHQIYPGSLFPYYPSNSELVHALGMLAFSRDVLSPFVNLGFIAIAFIAAWCIGRTRDAGPGAVAALAAVLATLHFSQDGGGTALNDIPQGALVLAAAALLANGGIGRGHLLVAGVAGGLAAGCKPIAALPVAVLFAATVVAARGGRGRAAAAVSVGLLAGGGFWYVRNLVWIGTPLPGAGPGPLEGPAAEQLNDSSFAAAVRAGDASLGSLTAGLHEVFGAAWVPLAALVLAGLAAGLARPRAGWERAAALAGLANLVAWPFLPFTEVVVFAVRYAIPAIALGIVLLALRRPLRVAGPWLFLAVAALAVLHVHPLSQPHGKLAIALAVFAAALVLPWLRRPPHVSRSAVAVVGLVLVVASAPGAQRYLRDRYRLDQLRYTGPEAPAVKAVFAWAQDLRGQRIGIEGGELQYPLYGADLSNHVQYVGREAPDGGFARIEACPEWRRAVDAGRYRYVVTVPWGSESRSPSRPSPQAEWTAADPGARAVLSPGSGITVFRIDRPLDPSGCA